MIDGLDPVIHAPKRLAAMAVLANSASASFRFLRDYLQISDSDLSKHMSALEAAGYVTAAKDGRGRGATTTFKLTKLGQTAYLAHRQALHAILDDPLPDQRE
ncbi:transcriptional regulator [Kribbella catacumbae]|uniref:transcriptional regulator n=1 Tax=Kribbella catacumbae TaxID=460086 RepID=UPI0003746502|nr:transcriptional regulator [Kribbella catacumbae]